MKKLTNEEISILRPAIHAHATLLTAAGLVPAEALAVAAETAAVTYSELCDEALEKAFLALAVEPRGVVVNE